MVAYHGAYLREVLARQNKRKPLPKLSELVGKGKSSDPPKRQSQEELAANMRAWGKVLDAQRRKAAS